MNQGENNRGNPFATCHPEGCCTYANPVNPVIVSIPQISNFQYQVSSPVIPSYNGDAIESPLVRVESDGGKRLPPRSCSPGTARLPPRTRGGAEAPRPQAMHACLRSPRGSRGFRLASREPVETDVTVTGDFRTNAIAASTMSLAPQQFAIWPALLRSGVLGEPALPRRLPVWR